MRKEATSVPAIDSVILFSMFSFLEVDRIRKLHSSVCVVSLVSSRFLLRSAISLVRLHVGGLSRHQGWVGPITVSWGGSTGSYMCAEQWWRPFSFWLIYFKQNKIQNNKQNHVKQTKHRQTCLKRSRKKCTLVKSYNSSLIHQWFRLKNKIVDSCSRHTYNH